MKCKVWEYSSSTQDWTVEANPGRDDDLNKDTITEVKNGKYLIDFEDGTSVTCDEY